MLDLLAPQVGLEPTTLRLTAECSAIELLRSVWRELRSCLKRLYQNPSSASKVLLQKTSQGWEKSESKKSKSAMSEKRRCSIRPLFLRYRKGERPRHISLNTINRLLIDDIQLLTQRWRTQEGFPLILPSCDSKTPLPDTCVPYSASCAPCAVRVPMLLRCGALLQCGNEGVRHAPPRGN